ncbi:tubulin-specific chaperone C-like isoform X1 [Dermacentor andersoni]|uniref:tubulin-specific chaperone C-like isoform X1 n=1 Tax=Dermacentor andersoni TaxID=34620 RepID=UPI003B3AA545
MTSGSGPSHANDLPSSRHGAPAQRQQRPLMSEPHRKEEHLSMYPEWSTLQFSNDARSERRGFPASTLGFQSKSGETLMLSDVNGKDMELDSLGTCKVTVHGCPATLFACWPKNCHIRCGPMATSMFMEECKGCTFHIACQQLRVHDVHKCKF